MKVIHLERESRNLTKPVEQIVQHSDRTSNQALNQKQEQAHFLIWKIFQEHMPILWKSLL